MSEFGKPKQCNNGCGALIYFDRDSPTGHPSPDKWVPLEIKEGRRTDTVHNCPKKKNGHTLQEAAATATATIKPDTLKFAESLLDIVQDYIRLKTKELETAAATTGVAAGVK
jgi:hypothetical protein